MHTTHTTNGEIKVKPHNATYWNHAIDFGRNLTVYLTDAELLTLCNEVTRVLADKWATAAADEDTWNNYRAGV
jgi:hypothetical protein